MDRVKAELNKSPSPPASDSIPSPGERLLPLASPSTSPFSPWNTSARPVALRPNAAPVGPPLSHGRWPPVRLTASVITQLLPVDADIMPPVHGVVDPVRRKTLVPALTATGEQSRYGFLAACRREIVLLSLLTGHRHDDIPAAGSAYEAQVSRGLTTR